MRPLTLKVPVWWRRAVLPSLPWGFLSFPLTLAFESLCPRPSPSLGGRNFLLSLPRTGTRIPNTGTFVHQKSKKRLVDPALLTIGGVVGKVLSDRWRLFLLGRVS